MEVVLNSIGLAAPGLMGWRRNLPVLRAGQPGDEAEPPAPNPSILPANERRRATRTIKLALQVAQEALEQSGLPGDQIGTVFASADGDLELADRINRALTLPDRPVSPTDFHNSVNNAAGGYWAIATHSRKPSTMISADRYTFSVGLLEAVLLVEAEQSPVMLVAYDSPTPHPISTAHALTFPFAAALLMSPSAIKPSSAAELQPRLNLRLSHDKTESRMADSRMEAMRTGNPIARVLPLLQAISRGPPGVSVLPYLSGQQLTIEIGAR